MLKTFAQQSLEVAHGGRGIRIIVREALERYRGQTHMVLKAAVALNCSEPTLRAWCHDLKINIDDYRQPSQGQPVNV